MLLREEIKIKDFLSDKKLLNQKKKIYQLFKKLIKSNNEILFSMSKDYKDSYKKNLVTNCKNKKIINIIGMGGSLLGAKAIYSFLKPKNKIFNFFDSYRNSNFKKNSKKNVNLIISKSGNTLETITNSNILLDKKEKNIFITENKKSYLIEFAKKLKAEVIHHNNFIGGRYAVLSEVGMLPAELMGLNSKNFRKFNDLIKNKKFLNSLVNSVSCILAFKKKNFTNSIVLNYDDNSNDFFLLVSTISC